MNLAGELQELSRVVQTIIDVAVLALACFVVSWVVLVIGGRWLR